MLRATHGFFAPSLYRRGKNPLRITPIRTDRPLFAPLLSEWFDAFAAGTQTEEWRRLGPRWNEGTCRVGRSIVLARGYGWPRLLACIAAISIRTPDSKPRRALFGARTACIVLQLDAITAIERL